METNDNTASAGSAVVIEPKVKKVVTSPTPSEEPESVGDWCYGASEPKTFITYTMAGGGSHWWNYVAYFDKDGEQTDVYIESTDGREHQDNRTLWANDNHLVLSVDAPKSNDDDDNEGDWHQLSIAL